ncbi:hypothetical protein BDQ12DRAFT_704732 [Crucibulum laeve]|uniref:Serine/threonine-protein kinase Tel1 n=1 Tax=Crucibulum laeve TaxID=68775 RepID=A0A5C3M578_9AGAR|nr:hypothetical protein BDQ12DRAFT_704732 [Crucibulum laeve]
MNSMNDICRNLKSDKVKQRQEGLTAILEFCDNQKAVLSYSMPDGEEEPELWIPVLQSLFTAVLSEKATYNKRTPKSTAPTAVAERRLAAAATVVRRVIEKIVARMDYKVAKVVFEHLTQTIINRTEILVPIAADYLKAMEYMLNYNPHMEHLRYEHWVTMVQIAFNIILNDPIKATFAEDDSTESNLGPTEVDSNIYMDDEGSRENDYDDDLPTVVSQPRKRGRREPSAQPAPSPKAHMRPRPGNQIAVSTEQNQCSSLLCILLCSPSTPLISPKDKDRHIPPAILRRLQRFLDSQLQYTSLLNNYLQMSVAVLGHLSLNYKTDVERFARGSWDGLVELWSSTKVTAMKENLVVVLHLLFPYVTIDNDIDSNLYPFDWSHGLRKLWKALNAEVGGRGMLSFDSLRLKVLDSNDPNTNEQSAFIAHTFRAGWNFDSGNTLAWVTLQLQADCAAKLFQLSESPGARTEKRMRMEDPIAAILSSIRTHNAENTRCYHLQVLLFFVDRHWSILHDALKGDVVNTLLQLMSIDDSTTQSWVFSNFAAITYAEALAISDSDDISSSINAATWDSIWTHAMRRVYVPAICRGACHAGHVLLRSSNMRDTKSRPLLPSHRVLSEIEALAKDIDVQGPIYPFDAVCMFLGHCLRIASQDVRLYRMQLEEKVLAWLLDSWKVTSLDRKKIPLYNVEDLLLLLESLCGLGKRSDMVSSMFLPESPIIDRMTENNRTEVIRDFLLQAKLPAFRSHRPSASTASSTVDNLSAPIGNHMELQNKTHLSPPRGRERKISSYLVKILDAIIAECDQSKPSVEMGRRSLDLAVIALAFETLLLVNGTTYNRQVLQTSTRVISIVADKLNGSDTWTEDEKSFVIMGLEPLVSSDTYLEDPHRWNAMLLPDTRSGIRAQILKEITAYNHDLTEERKGKRVKFLRMLWQNADIHDALTNTVQSLRNVLEDIIQFHKPQEMEQLKDKLSPATSRVLRLCITFLAMGPLLQSLSGEPTRDKRLTKLILHCASYDVEKFFVIASFFFEQARQNTLSLTTNHIEQFASIFEEMLLPYDLSRNDRLKLLVIQFLDSTIDTWCTPHVSTGELGDRIRNLCQFLAHTLRNKTNQSWIIRDTCARFLSRYLRHDPTERVWMIKDEDHDGATAESLLNNRPSVLLPYLGSDEDIRIRFRVAVDNARLFSEANISGRTPIAIYDSIRRGHTEFIDHYEKMITRILSLGNIMIVSSDVRRGPYWHLLETCLHPQGIIYSRHVEAILIGVAKRLGFPSLSVLCESYACQLAYSLRQGDYDLLRLPPHLLGYPDRKQCAEATFHPFTPTNVLSDGDEEFENHCRMIRKSTGDGLRECFGDIVGFQTVKWFDEFSSADSSDALEVLLKTRTFGGELFESCLTSSLDGIIIAILRTLSDQDTTPDSPIFTALESFSQSGGCSQTFFALTKYRNLDLFKSHTPNLPSFPVNSVLRGIIWLTKRLPNLFTKAITYHVLHQLMADVQRSPLVNEQLRLVNALTLWISFRYQDFEDASLLFTLARGATSFLAQPDLVRCAQSILEWIFLGYKKSNVTDTRIQNLLVRICSFAHDYSLRTLDHEDVQMGKDLLQWVDEQACSLLAVSKRLVLKAVPAWPHQPSAEISKLYANVSSDDLSRILNGNYITSNKFRLVRRLRDHAMLGNYDAAQFASADFWRLKECIPNMDHLQDDDIEAFATLLVLNHGSIDSFHSEPPSSNSPRDRHRRSFRKRLPAPANDDSSSARDCIIIALLNMLEGDNASHVYDAYCTLRLIMDILPPEDVQQSKWPAEYREEVDYLQKSPQQRKIRAVRDLQDLLTSDFYLESAKDFPRWITMLTTLLSDTLSLSDPVFAQLDSILHSDIEFAQEMLPVMVHTLLAAEIHHAQTGVGHRRLISQYFTSILSCEFAHVQCVRSIVDTVLHLRYFSPNISDALAYDKWLDINFILLARNAIFCGAYTTALLFLELASEYSHPVADVGPTEEILYDIYAHIDEPDGFYGIKTKDFHRFLTKRFHHEKQWEKAFRFHGATMEAGSTEMAEEEGLLKSFHSFGFDHLAMDTLQRNHADTAHASSMNYRLGWRTETWDLPDVGEYAPGVSLYRSLRAVYRERDTTVVNELVRRSLLQETARMKALGSEDITEIREVTRDLMCLTQVLQWRESSVQNWLESRKPDFSQRNKFVNIDEAFDFSDLENIMATRISLIRSVRFKEESKQIGSLRTPFACDLIDMEKASLLRLSQAAREANQIQIALNSVVRAKSLEAEPSFEVSQEFAKVLWIQKEEKLAVQFLQSLIHNKSTEMEIDGQDNETTKALLFAQLGTWMAEACLERPLDIWQKYFEPAISTLEKTTAGPAARNARVYHECALFAEKQYHAIMKSPDNIRWKVYIERKKQEIQQGKDELSKAPPGSNATAMLTNNVKKARKVLQQDEMLYKTHSDSRNKFLEQAADMYARCLHSSDDFDDDAAIRFCSLWFAHFDDDEVLKKTLPEALKSIPSRKLVFLAHQLTARLANSDSVQINMNQECLQELVLRMCREHPFHSLYQLFCLQPAERPIPSSAPRRQPGRQTALTPPAGQSTERALAAFNIFERLRQNEGDKRVRDVEELCIASLQWAKYQIKDDDRYKNKSGQSLKIPQGLKILKIKDLRVPVTTYHTPIDPTMKYVDCVWISGYETKFETAGGINLPKITVCLGSDGGKYKQLFKGEGSDDLRQDAVMEQVFELVNTVLRRDRETRRRALTVRVYKVIPLDPHAGLLEFVGNTNPLRTWLIRAHPKYRPKDMRPDKAQSFLGSFRGKTAQEQINAFRLVKKDLKPVMRHYFTEKHRTPISWFSMRLSYTRSVATTSIVGHILGLGDRHTSNILIDNVSGEVIHIDLGIAFDQGKLLGVPERVPFRMTADMVDGMGTTGTQGVFQRCAEETLRVMREGSDVIMTVLEVFKHDPLHSWTASELRVKHAQGVTPSIIPDTSRVVGVDISMSSGSAEEAADRALSSVSRKLDKSLSVEATVNELIAEATDEANLGTIFHGWGPHL